MQYRQTQDPAEALAALPFLQSLDQYYPEISRWYLDKVLPGVTAGSDILLLAEDHGQLAGIALGKRSPEETKLRCLRVAPPWQNSGLGLKLLERMFELLDTDKPLCTVSEELLHQYSRPFVMRYGFNLSAVDKGKYRPGKLEYQFNH